MELKIVDEQGQAVPQGDVGEIFVKGPTVMPGYWKPATVGFPHQRSGEEVEAYIVLKEGHQTTPDPS